MISVLRKFGFWATMALLLVLGARMAQDYPIESSGDIHNILPLWEQAKFIERQLKWRQINLEGVKI